MRQIFLIFVYNQRMNTKTIEHYFDRLFPICRSITGNGVRESLKILQEIIPLKIHEIPTGKKVFDWEIPKEWNIRNAYIITPDGKKICDFKKNNLHIVSYSVPIKKKLSFEELNSHLHSIPKMPDAIPYLTSYYQENWGFCITHNEYKKLPKKGIYEVVIDTELKNGNLTYGDLVLKGETEEEILFSTYICHPSMANNELSGPLVAAFLYQKISQIKKRKYSYRFVFAPETIGIIAYLHAFGKLMKQRTQAGFVLTCCGDDGAFTYKMSKHENSLADRVAKHILKYSDVPFSVVPFSVGGSDERQYCSSGFNLPVGSLTRSMYKKYKEYHTSLDNKNFISFEAMEKTIDAYFSFAKALELNDNYKNKISFCEPQLGKRGLYPHSADAQKRYDETIKLLHFLSWADGKLDLIEIAEKQNACVLDFENIVEQCKNAKLI